MYNISCVCVCVCVCVCIYVYIYSGYTYMLYIRLLCIYYVVVVEYYMRRWESRLLYSHPLIIFCTSIFIKNRCFPVHLFFYVYNICYTLIPSYNILQYMCPPYIFFFMYNISLICVFHIFGGYIYAYIIRYVYIFGRKGSFWMPEAAL
jgi:hypothetical protein